jgi:hypothetical protein
LNQAESKFESDRVRATGGDQMGDLEVCAIMVEACDLGIDE